MKQVFWPFGLALLFIIAICSSLWAGVKGFVSEFLDRWQRDWPNSQRIQKGFRATYIKSENV